MYLSRRYLRSILCSLLWWYRRWRCTGPAASECSGKQEATTGKGLCGDLLYSSCHQLKGLSHLIHITAERYSSYQQYYYHGSYYKGRQRNWPREPVTCFYHRWSSIQEGVIHGTQRGHLSNEGPGFLLGHHSCPKLPPQANIPIRSVYIVKLKEVFPATFYLGMGGHFIFGW